MLQRSQSILRADSDRLVADTRYGLDRQVVGGHVVSVLTGRNLFVFAPPETPGNGGNDEADELLIDIENVLHDAAAARQKAAEYIGSELLSAYGAKLIVPDDASSLTDGLVVNRI